MKLLTRQNLLLAGAGLLVLILIVYGAFLFFGKKPGGVSSGTIATTSFPAAGTTAAPQAPAPELGVPQASAGETVAPRLVKITAAPVAYGVGLLAVTDSVVATVGSTTATTTVPDVEVRYVDRASGNIYAYRVIARTLTRITNQTVPGIQEAAFAPDGSYAYLRYESSRDAGDTMNTYALPIPEGTGFELESGLASVFATKGGLTTLLPSSSGSTATVAGFDGSKAHTLFTSELSSILLSPAGANTLATTKASAQMGGYAFLVSGSSFSRILGPLSGLTVLPSPSGAKLLYGYVENGALHTEVLTLKTHEIAALPLGTLPEKCAWTADEGALYCGVPRTVSGTLPDGWYQGTTSFSDRIWRVDLAGRVATLAIDPTITGNVDIDVVAPAVDAGGTALIFTNKTDGSLWAYSLK